MECGKEEDDLTAPSDVCGHQSNQQDPLDRIQALEKECSEHRALVDSLHKDNAEQKTLVETLQKENTTQQTLIAEQQLLIESLQEQKSNQPAKVEDDANDQKTLITEQKTLIESLEEEILGQKQMIETLEIESTTQKARTETLELESTTQKTHIDVLQQQVRTSSCPSESPPATPGHRPSLSILEAQKIDKQFEELKRQQQESVCFFDYCEDSPFFRKRLNRQEEWAKQLGYKFGKVNKRMNNFLHACSSFSEMTSELSTVLKAWDVVMEDDPNHDTTANPKKKKMGMKKSSSTQTDDSNSGSVDEMHDTMEQESEAPLTLAMKNLGNLLAAVSEITTNLSLHFETLLATSVGGFPTYLKKLWECKRVLYKADENFEACLLRVIGRKNKDEDTQPSSKNSRGGSMLPKMLRKKNKEVRTESGGEEQLSKFEQEHSQLIQANIDMEVNRFDYVVEINDVRGTRRLSVVEDVCAAFYSLTTFFHEGLEIAESMKETFADLNAKVQIQKQLYEKRRKIMSMNRATLVTQLSQPTENRFNIREKFPDHIRKVVSVSRRGKTVTIEREGYLRKRSTNIRGDWKRRWFALQEGYLFYFRSLHDLKPQPVVNVLISTVRRCMGKNDPMFSFEIISPKQRVYTLQAESEAELNSWISVFQNCAESLLIAQKSDKDNEEIEQDPKLRAKDLEARQTGWQIIRELNSVCADCGEPDPSWASINLGVMMCIECSGIHRSLGVHVSKVRSITLDSWDTELVVLMQHLGNPKINEFYEGTPAEELAKKPTSKSSRTEKDDYIRLKYVQKMFLKKEVLSGLGEAADCQKSLVKAAKNTDIDTLMVLLAVSVDINLGDPDDLNRTALHNAALANSVVCVEYLFQNNASLDVLDDEGNTPHALAEANECTEVATLLAKLHHGY